MTFIIHCIEQVYYFLWGDWIRLPLPGGTLSLPLLVLLLIPAGIYFTVRTRGLQLRLLPDMVRLITGSAKPEDSEQNRKAEELSALQAHGSVWAISSVSWPQSQQVAQALFSGCG